MLLAESSFLIELRVYGELLDKSGVHTKREERDRKYANTNWAD
jgi:hypothetical protein